MRYAIFALALSLALLPASFAATGSMVPTMDDPAIYTIGVSGMT